jgi:hypothetical protein
VADVAVVATEIAILATVHLVDVAAVAVVKKQRR